MEQVKFGALATLVALLLVALAGVGITAIANNSKLQQDYNKAIVACVQSGKDPAACRNALKNNP